MAGDDAASRSRRIVVLSALLYGTTSGRWLSQARPAAVRPIHTRARHLPVVPFRGPSTGRCHELAAKAGCEEGAHRSKLGRQPATECRALVRPPDARARRIRCDPDVLLYARIARAPARSYQPSTPGGRFRRLLWPHDPPLCLIGWIARWRS